MPVAEEVDELGPLGPRADEAHVAPQHVEELRQLVERACGAGTRRCACAGRCPRCRPGPMSVGSVRTLFGVASGCGGCQRHRAELEHLEAAAVATDPQLPEQDRARRARTGRRAAIATQQRRQHDQHASPATTRSKTCLIGELPALGIDRVETEERQPAEVVERHAHVDALEQARHERHLEPARLALLDERDQLVVRRRAEAEDDVARRRSRRRRGRGRPASRAPGACRSGTMSAGGGSESR